MNTFEALAQAFRDCAVDFTEEYKPRHGSTLEVSSQALVPIKQAKKNKLVGIVKFSPESGVDSFFRQSYLFRGWQVETTNELRKKLPPLPLFIWNRENFPIPLWTDFVSSDPLRILSCFSPVIFFLEEWIIARLYAYRYALGDFYTNAGNPVSQYLERKALIETCNEEFFTTARIDSTVVTFQDTNWKKLVSDFRTFMSITHADETWIGVLVQACNDFVAVPEDSMDFSKFREKVESRFSGDTGLVQVDAIMKEFHKYQFPKEMPTQVSTTLKKEQYSKRENYRVNKLLITTLQTELYQVYGLQNPGKPNYLSLVRSCQVETLKIRASACSVLDSTISTLLSDLFEQIVNTVSQQRVAYVQRAVAHLPNGLITQTPLNELERDIYATIIATITDYVAKVLSNISVELDKQERDFYSSLLDSNKNKNSSWDALLKLYLTNSKYLTQKTEKTKKETSLLAKSRNEAWLPVTLDTPLSEHGLGRGILSLCSTKHMIHKIINAFFVTGHKDYTEYLLAKDTTAKKLGSDVKDWIPGDRTISSAEISTIIDKIGSKLVEKKSLLNFHKDNPEGLYYHLQGIITFAKSLRRPGDPYSEYIERVTKSMWVNNLPTKISFNNEVWKSLDGQITLSSSDNIFARLRPPVDPVAKAEYERDFGPFKPPEISWEDFRLAMNDRTERQSLFESFKPDGMSWDDFDEFIQDKDLRKDLLKSLKDAPEPMVTE